MRVRSWSRVIAGCTDSASAATPAAHGAAKLVQAVVRAAENAAGWLVDLAIQIGEAVVNFTDLAVADMKSAFHVIGGFFATLAAQLRGQPLPAVAAPVIYPKAAFYHPKAQQQVFASAQDYFAWQGVDARAPRSRRSRPSPRLGPLLRRL